MILDEKEFDLGRINIIAYFTLSHKSLIPFDVSKSKLQAASGFKDAQPLHFVLIGQLGKYTALNSQGEITSAGITGHEILDYAFEVIRSADNLIPCRCVLVECSSNEKVQRVYTDYGFSFFQHDGDHYQFYKRI